MWLGLIGVIVIALGSADARAAEAVVTTYDGRTLTGELINQSTDSVTLRISGINTPIPRRSIQSIEMKDTPEEQYRKLRAELDDQDQDGRYRLAYMMYEKKWYGLAIRELESMSSDFPDSDKVRSLMTVIRSRVERQEQEEAASGRTRSTTTNTEPAAPATAGNPPGPDQRLSEEQVNAIRVYEVDLDEEPRITVPQDTIKKLFEKYGKEDELNIDEREFRRLSGHEQLALMFELQARDLYPEVLIRQDPPALKAYRIGLHQRYVMNYCATNGCHGDNSPGGLFLYRMQPNSNATVYTNFYILNRMKREQRSMIDRDEPRRSLLLQYGLKRDVASNPHPEVQGWRAQFMDEDDARFKQYADALDLLWKPAPDYGISYTPPVFTDNPSADADTEQP